MKSCVWNKLGFSWMLCGLMLFVAGCGDIQRLSLYMEVESDTSEHHVTTEVAPGVQHQQIKRGPLLINLLELSPDVVTLRPYRALEAGIGAESLVSLMHRHNALAAINGGYFQMGGTFNGESVGALMIDGQWISEPEQNRAAIGLLMEDGQQKAIVDRIQLALELVSLHGEALPIDGINRLRYNDELIVYRPIFHRVTLTTAVGVEVIVEDNRIVQIRDGKGNSRIPERGYVLSASGEKADWLRSHLATGDEISIREEIRPQRVEMQAQWQAVEQVIGAGPLLLRGGIPTSVEEYEMEGFQLRFYGLKHPRTAIATKPDGTLLLVTIRAAHPMARRGVTLPELTELMIQWGATDAINLDGGGSTTMIINKKIVSFLRKPRRGRGRDRQPLGDSQVRRGDARKNLQEPSVIQSGDGFTEANPHDLEKKQDVIESDQSSDRDVQASTTLRRPDRDVQASTTLRRPDRDNGRRPQSDGRTTKSGNRRSRPRRRDFGRSISDALLIFHRLR